MCKYMLHKKIYKVYKEYNYISNNARNLYNTFR